MSSFDIPYGKGYLSVNVPDEHLVGVLRPTDRGRMNGSEIVQVSRALESPLGSGTLPDLAKEKKHILIITSDHTRPMPSHITMPLLLDQLRQGSTDAEIRILIATGTHRPMQENEIRRRFGDRIADEETLINHICEDKENIVFKGILPSGGELWLNALVDWSDLLIAEGFVEPHFFAGFSGGRKSVLPGIAGRQSIFYNHNAAFIGHPLARQGSLEGNPLHKDMLYAAEAAGLRFILNVLLDSGTRIAAAYAGEPHAAHAAACADCLARTGVPRVEADIVITSNGGYPLDQNVYQSVKGMTSAEACVRNGGVIILCAALGDGAGGDGFYRLMKESANPQALLQTIGRTPSEQTCEDQWEAQILARVMAHATVIFVTDQENQALIESMGMKWAKNPETAMETAQRIAGAKARIAVVPDGPGVIVQK
jgi:nickel-dependent lactate racemase